MILPTTSYLFLTLLFLFHLNVQSIDVKCSKHLLPFVVLGNISVCRTTNNDIKNQNEYFAVHLTDFDDEMQGVTFYNQEIFYLPHFQENIKTSLLVLSVVNCKLKIILSYPLLGLNKLEYFNVSRNDIEYIPGSLFQFNPKIKVAIFDNNKIKAIGTNAFWNLVYLGLQNLTCYSETLENKENVTTAIKKIEEKCINFSGDSFSAEYLMKNSALDDLKKLNDKYDDLHDDIQILMILTSIILSILILSILIFIIYLLRNKISQTYTLVREKLQKREDDEIIIIETSSINYASCSHINESYAESTNNLENLAIYDSVYADSTVVDDDKAIVAGLRAITPNSTNYASVEEILTHLDQELAKDDSSVTKDEVVWENSKIFEENAKSEIQKRSLQNQQSHKIGSESTNAIFEHESMSQANHYQSPQKMTEFIKSEQEKSVKFDETQELSKTDDMTSEQTYSNITPLNSPRLEHESSNSEQTNNNSSNSNNNSLTRQNSTQNPSTKEIKLQKPAYKTKIPQSMNPKALNLENIDEKITHFEQTSPVFADVAQKLIKSASESQKSVNQFGFRSLTYADVAQKIGAQTDTTPRSTLKRQNSNISSPRSPHVKDLAKKFSDMESAGQKLPIINTNPFIGHSEARNENADYAEPYFRTSSEIGEQNVSEYTEPYQSNNN